MPVTIYFYRLAAPLIAPHIEQESYLVGCQETPSRDFDHTPTRKGWMHNMPANNMNLLRNEDVSPLYHMRDNWSGGRRSPRFRR
jgi:hypothetical protein